MDVENLLGGTTFNKVEVAAVAAAYSDVADFSSEKNDPEDPDIGYGTSESLRAMKKRKLPAQARFLDWNDLRLNAAFGGQSDPKRIEAWGRLFA